jgi:hypothetical protein
VREGPHVPVENADLILAPVDPREVAAGVHQAQQETTTPSAGCRRLHMAEPQDFTDPELLRIYNNPKADLSKLSRAELERLDKITGGEAPGVVGKDEPGTFWGGVGQSLKDQVLNATVNNPMLQGAANPRTVGDIASLLIPGGIEGAVSGAKGLALRVKDAAAERLRPLVSGVSPASLCGTRLMLGAPLRRACRIGRSEVRWKDAQDGSSADVMKTGVSRGERAFQRLPLRGDN